ncbi:ribonuclease activity regulator RraA [Brevibacterium sp. SMBL_HHYL_HB1]|uniref:ribonuclease activity regulator RraA n=1 Tax=Brevibacterium sp. SMBL_HHYL_HB1 TaxID=2777556 RepID=UPI001BA96E08|nr:ribonuclease activity regulator RraA [Brevibacterium sp. SMBL_HHYL_HB1]QUL77868.1 ribonuclease activity regulator RraA [Brevibacterium sp. SMBL_HHYL_HB1]
MKDITETVTCPLSESAREAFKHVSTATLTTQLFGRGLRNSHLEGLRALNPANQRMVGEAFTLRSIPAREDIDVLEIFQDYDHPQRKAVESVPAGSVLVVDSRGKTRAASLGHILATRLKTRGAAGIVTDGTVRDAEGFENLDLPTLAKGAAASTNLAIHHVVDMQVPIGCAEVAVYPGDIIVGDRDGVVCVPRHLAEEVAAEALEQEKLEAFILEKIEAGNPLRGTYPPDQNTMQEYRAQGEV